MRYLKSSKYTDKDGIEEREPDEVVDEQYVERFIEPATISFFRELGGTEKVTKSNDGTITVRSTRPDGAQKRFTVFVPETSLHLEDSPQIRALFEAFPERKYC